jgi:hypothetical protein
MEVTYHKCVAVNRFTPHAISQRDVTTLGHEARDDPVEWAAFEVQWLATLPFALLSCDQCPEVLNLFRQQQNRRGWAAVTGMMGTFPLTGLPQ